MWWYQVNIKYKESTKTVPDLLWKLEVRQSLISFYLINSHILLNRCLYSLPRYWHCKLLFTCIYSGYLTNREQNKESVFIIQLKDYFSSKILLNNKSKFWTIHEKSSYLTCLHCNMFSVLFPRFCLIYLLVCLRPMIDSYLFRETLQSSTCSSESLDKNLETQEKGPFHSFHGCSLHTGLKIIKRDGCSAKVSQWLPEQNTG